MDIDSGISMKPFCYTCGWVFKVKNCITSRQHEAALIKRNCSLNLPEGGAVVTLCQKMSPTYDVRWAKTTIIPLRCKIEVDEKSQTPPLGSWLFEGHHLKCQSVVIARAILESCASIPVCILNASDQSHP